MRIQIKHTAFLLAALIAFPCGDLMAQNDQASATMGTVVQGEVVDAAGEPIFEALVLDAKGKALGSTDLFGRFEIKNVAANELSFRKNGYEIATRVNQPAEAGKEKALPQLKVTMRPDASRQDEVLDYGYSLLRRRGVISEAISTIDGQQLEDIPSSSFSQMLEGQLLGLGTLETSSDPGAATVEKFIRGKSTMNGTAPLVVIDGSIMQDYNLDYLTAAEVENIVVLKDAAATAIYGLCGANGVIVINTKGGLPGSFDVRVTADMSIQQISREPEQLSSFDYATLRNQAWMNDGQKGLAPFSAEQMEQIKSGNNPLYPNNNYFKQFMRDFGTMERVGVSLSGGTTRTRVWSNLNVMNQTSLMNQETDKYVAAPRRFWVNFRAKVDVDISKHVRAFAAVSGNVRNDRLAGKMDPDNDPQKAKAYRNSDIYSTIFSQSPTMIGPITEDGRVTTTPAVTQPTYGILNRSGFTRYSGMYLSTHAGVTVDLDFITRGLSLTGKLDYQSSNDRYNYMTQDYRRFYYDNAAGDFVQLGSTIDTDLTGGVEGTLQYALSYIGQIDYKRAFGKHNVEAHVYSYFTEEQFKTVEADYPAVGFPYFDHNTGLNVGYNYDDRYVVGATFGLTASDELPRHSRYTFVPAFSAAWVASNESFLKDVDWLSLLKVRASYGEVVLDNFKVGNFRYIYQDYIRTSGSISLLGNANLQAEKHKIQNYGIDLGLWNKLDFSFDYFRRRTDNMLIDSGNSTPGYQGITIANYMKINEGQMKNSGVELGLCYATDLGRGWSIHAGVNYAHSQNEVIYTGEMAYPGAGEDYSGYAYTHRIQGQPLGQQFGYLVDRSKNNGYISTEEELVKYKAMYKEIGTPRLGDFIYKDVNSDGVINEKDMSPIGKGSVPTDFTTFRLGFGWKGIELDLMFQGVTGYYGDVKYFTERTDNGIYNDLHLAAWTPERAAAGADIKAPALSYNVASTSSLANDFQIANRSFWRLKNASLSYTLPASVMRNAGIKRLKIVLSGQNLFTFSGLDSKVIDPEIGSMTALPLMRVVNLGVKIDF